MAIFCALHSDLTWLEGGGGGVGKTGQVRYVLEPQQNAEEKPAESTIHGWKAPCWDRHSSKYHIVILVLNTTNCCRVIVEVISTSGTRAICENYTFYLLQWPLMLSPIFPICVFDNWDNQHRTFQWLLMFSRIIAIHAFDEGWNEHRNFQPSMVNVLARYPDLCALRGVANLCVLHLYLIPQPCRQTAGLRLWPGNVDCLGHV